MKSVLILLSILLSFFLGCKPTLETEFKYLHGEWDYILESDIQTKHISKGEQNWKSMNVPGLPPDWHSE